MTESTSWAASLTFSTHRQPYVLRPRLELGMIEQFVLELLALGYEPFIGAKPLHELARNIDSDATLIIIGLAEEGHDRVEDASHDRRHGRIAELVAHQRVHDL